MLKPRTLLMRRQELVWLLIKKMIAILLTPGLGLAPEGTTTTPTRVETRLRMIQTTEINTSRPWGTFWFSKKDWNDQVLKTSGWSDFLSKIKTFRRHVIIYEMKCCCQIRNKMIKYYFLVRNYIPGLCRSFLRDPRLFLALNVTKPFNPHSRKLNYQLSIKVMHNRLRNIKYVYYTGFKWLSSYLQWLYIKQFCILFLLHIVIWNLCAQDCTGVWQYT